MKRDATKNMGLTRDMDTFTVIVTRHSMKNKVSKRGIVIDIPMVIMKIVANLREERDAPTKDAIVKTHGMKNIHSRGMTKILTDAVMKRHVVKKVG